MLLIARRFLRQFSVEDGKRVTAFSPAVEAAIPDATTPIEPLDVVVRRTIERAIAQCDGNIPKAAAPQVSPSTLSR